MQHCCSHMSSNGLDLLRFQECIHLPVGEKLGIDNARSLIRHSRSSASPAWADCTTSCSPTEALLGSTQRSSESDRVHDTSLSSIILEDLCILLIMNPGSERCRIYAPGLAHSWASTTPCCRAGNHREWPSGSVPSQPAYARSTFAAHRAVPEGRRSRCRARIVQGGKEDPTHTRYGRL